MAQGVAHVFVAVDHCNSECGGIHADKSANRFQALEAVRQGVRQHFGIVGKGVAAGLKLRHDHCSNYSRISQRTLTHPISSFGVRMKRLGTSMASGFEEARWGRAKEPPLVLEVPGQDTLVLFGEMWYSVQNKLSKPSSRVGALIERNRR